MGDISSCASLSLTSSLVSQALNPWHWVARFVALRQFRPPAPVLGGQFHHRLLSLRLGLMFWLMLNKLSYPPSCSDAPEYERQHAARPARKRRGVHGSALCPGHRLGIVDHSKPAA